MLDGKRNNSRLSGFAPLRLVSLGLLLCSLIAPMPACAGQEKLDNDNVAGDQYSSPNPALRPEILPPPQAELPTRPDSVSSETAQDLVTPGHQPIKASATITDIVLKAELMPVSPLSRYSGGKLVFYRVTLHNTGRTPVVIAGRDARLGAGADSVKAILAATLERHDNTLLTTGQKAAVAAAGIGTFGLASSLFYDHLTPSENKRRNLGIALGRDRGRHEVEAENLGIRLVMPGDETQGWVAFPAESLSGAKGDLMIPVMFPPYNSVSAIVKVSISNSPNPAKP
jgi:hypothetical protein